MMPAPPQRATEDGRDLIAERTSAIRLSGWGASFRFVQPRNLAFWVYLVLVAAGVFVIVRYFANATVVYGTPLTIATVVFAVYGGLFWWFTEHIDRYAHLPRKLIALAFLWGGFGAILMASFANTPILSLWTKAYGTSWASDWAAGLTAPINEELAKGVGLLLLIALASRAVATAFDGFILGAFIGLGFQIVEDVTYAIAAAGQGFGADPVGHELQTVAMRMAFGLGAHIAYSAIFCTGLVLFLGRPAQPRRRWIGVALMVTAMVLHGVWDNTAGIVGSAVGLLFVVWFGMTAITVFIVIRIFTVIVRTERSWMREVIAPEVVAGTLTEEEAATLAGDRRARQAYRRVKQDRTRRRHLLNAAHDLANELAAADGQDGVRVRFARQELARIRARPAAEVADPPPDQVQEGSANRR